MSVERLTERTGNFVILAKKCPFGRMPNLCKKCDCNGHREQQRVCPVIMELDRLAAYEDALTTDDGVMSPEKIGAEVKRSCEKTMELNERAKQAALNYQQKCRDIAQLEKENTALKSECDVAVRALEMAVKRLRMTPDYLIQQAKGDLQK